MTTEISVMYGSEKVKSLLLYTNSVFKNEDLQIFCLKSYKYE